MIAPWTIHGGRLGDARRAFPDVTDWLDLSTGINPHPWPGAGDQPIDWRALPDDTALHDLQAAAAAHFGVDPARVCAVPGSEIGLRLLGPLLPGPLAWLAPCYGTHAEIAPGHAIAPDEIMTTDARTILFAQPNNPDGRTIAPATVVALLAAGRHVVIDEAFADAMPACSMADRVTAEGGLVVVRSFGKFFGLAGVRLGFVIGPDAVLAALRARLGSWPVSAAALAIGTPAYRDRAWAADMRDRLGREAAALDAVLHSHGLAPRGACPLFQLAETDDAAALFDRLARRGILTRPFADQPRWLRFGLPGSAAALARLDRALGDG